MAVRRQKRMKRRRNMGKKSGKPVTRADKSLSRRISRLERAPEVKYIDFGETITPSAAGTAYSINADLRAGSDYNQRIGNQVISKRYYLQYRLFFQASETPTQIRCIAGWDLQNNTGGSFQLFTGSSPTSQELAVSLFDDRAGQINVNAPYNQNTKQRFKILYDRVHTYNPQTDLVQGAINVKKLIQLNNAKVQYSDDENPALPLTTLPSRNLFFAYFTSLTTDIVGINATHRFFYTDP